MSDPKSQPWYKNAIVYQIYPRSFKDSNDDGIGDLQGVIQKLEYLKELGVNAIWLCPFYPSPMVDFGYDISDYKNVDQIFGTLNDFDQLIKEAHAKGIKVIIDLVANHTSSLHPWFIESSQSKDSAKRDWYIWREANQINNWLSVFGGSAWQFDPKTDQYYFHSFLKEQPDLNWRNPDVREAIKDVVHFWLKKGVDGFRLDASVNLLEDVDFKDDPINPHFKSGSDDPYNSLVHLHSANNSETFEIIKSLCQVLGQYDNPSENLSENPSEKFIVSEVYAPPDQLKPYYRACQNGSHFPFDMGLIGLPQTATAFRNHIDALESNLREEDVPAFVIGNHDRSRVATRLGKERARLMAMLQLTLRGTPFIYYGDELGMTDGSVSHNQTKDPLEKNVPGMGLGRDPARMPMLWDNSLHAGFSNTTPWLTPSEESDILPASIQKENPDSMFNLYKNLIHLRINNDALKYGSYKSTDTGNDDILSFIRQYADQKILVILNFADRPHNCDISGKILLSTDPKNQKQEIDLKTETINPYEGMILKL